MKRIMGLLLLVCISALACGEDGESTPLPKLPVVEDKCEANSDCATAGQFCQPVCNTVGGYEAGPNGACSHTDGAVDAQYINECVSIPSCNASSEPELIPLMLSDRYLKIKGGLCRGTGETDRYELTFSKQILVAVTLVSTASVNSFQVTTLGVTSFGASGGSEKFKGEKLHRAVSGEQVTIKVDTLNDDDGNSRFIVPIEYDLEIWVYDLCQQDEDCIGVCDGGVCADCVSDSDCGEATPVCAKPTPYVPAICFVAEETE